MNNLANLTKWLRGEAVRVKRYHYVHIIDSSTNVSRCLVGPVVYYLKSSESCLFEPRPCISVPTRHYCVICNPIVTDSEGKPVLEATGQVRLRVGESEVRLERPPFPLYPGEEVQGGTEEGIHQLETIGTNEAFHLRCTCDFVREDGALVPAGMEWMERGPKTHIPRTEVCRVGVVKATLVVSSSALRLTARTDFTDRSGKARAAGESWLVREPGAYLPDVEEEVVGLIKGIVLTRKTAVHLRAKLSFVDIYGTQRRAGDEWLVTHDNASVHIPDVHEEVERIVAVTTLTSGQFCTVLHPVGSDGANRYGEEEVRRGETSFFLQPGEMLLDGVCDIVVVGKDEALLLKAMTTITVDSTTRAAGTQWMLHGPAEYIPTADAVILERRKLIALDKNEGVYLMNTNTGEVRAVIGTPYMPKEHEVLWEKHLPPEVEELLSCPGGLRKTTERDPNFQTTREKHRVVRFNVQHNAAVQIYDYRRRKPRIVLGPNMVMLEPHEEFTVLSLSGGKPKTPNALQSLQLFLGPRFSSDTISVETSDHARLRLRLSYSWQFDISSAQADGSSPDAPLRCFSVPDFIGDCCKTIASRVRGAVAAEDFDSFHRNSALIIRTAVFGMDEEGNVKKELRFTANDFVVTNIDVQSVEPTDEKTRDSLQKSVQLAIEITTKSQEAAARHGNELKDQEAKGHLERQRLVDKIAVEKAKTQWLELQAKSEAVQASGQSFAEAKAKAEALMIEVNSELEQAQLRAEAYKISAESELKKLQQRQEMELEYTRRQNDLEVDRERRVAEAEAEKVKRVVQAIGRETLIAIAQAGPELQAKLLGGLGLKGYLITDGNSPVNLFSAAQGMIGSGGKKDA